MSLARYPAMLLGCPTMALSRVNSDLCLRNTPTTYHHPPLHAPHLYTMATEAAPLNITYCGGKASP